MPSLKLFAGSLVIFLGLLGCTPKVGSGELMDMRRVYEIRKSAEIVQLLEPVVGVGAVRVQVSAELTDRGQVAKRSAAVLIDYIRTTDSDGQVLLQPHTDENLQLLSRLIVGAIGFDSSRGDTIDIINMDFVTP